jgi:hypothetical protein
LPSPLSMSAEPSHDREARRGSPHSDRSADIDSGDGKCKGGREREAEAAGGTRPGVIEPRLDEKLPRDPPGAEFEYHRRGGFAYFRSVVMPVVGGWPGLTAGGTRTRTCPVSRNPCLHARCETTWVSPLVQPRPFRCLAEHVALALEDHILLPPPSRSHVQPRRRPQAHPDGLASSTPAWRYIHVERAP